ncbi:NADPH-dependent FMN reductase [Paludibaculum fermentans]|uniref:NAD(P)H-dependent oxidoreductase n=1 Tax=Paludibaculum fermentans TaxID=1473598 RepID=A0A7S7NVK5_PALFE|nr:NAD(P)H-dependent oxidoreductase [Paludibaculum fermentans]QOY90555.1 NAD(P)H-dependent oxidoreductase [Paludibaculum fermentans]
MPENPLHLAIVVGSTRQGRFAPTIAQWFAAQAAKREDLTVDVIDLAKARLPDVLSDQRSEAVAAVSPRLSRADAFVVITPEYNHSFPAPLKTLIDWHSQEWHAKPIGFVSYGGVSGGLRAVEQLRQIFAEMHAMTVRDSVSFAGVWTHFEPDGQLKNADRSNRSATKMLNQLVWWGKALRDAKSKQPYAA